MKLVPSSVRPLLLGPLVLAPLAGSAAAQALLYTQAGLHGADQFGSSVVILPDVDADGVEDYAVGAPFDDPQQNGQRPGSVKLYSGKTGGLLRTIAGPSSMSEFGTSLAAVRDVSGDGRADLLIGAPNASHTIVRQGAAYLFATSTGLEHGRYLGASMDESLGFAVANVGDTDGDGLEDYAVGAPFADVSGLVDNGRVRVYGVAGGVIQDIAPQTHGAHCGWSIAPAGDVNLDGRADILVGMPGLSTSGKSFNGGAQLHLGGGGASFGVYGTENYEQLGWSVSTLGDVTGDGRPEVAIGSPYFDGSGSSRGRVIAYNAWTGASLWQNEGLANGWKHGWSIVPCGDYDGDGVRDVAIGALGLSTANSGAIGGVRIHDAATGASVTTIFGWQVGSDCGRAIASGRDFNDDGRQDILIGSPAEDGAGNNSGFARLYLVGVMRPTPYGPAKTASNGCVPKIGSVGVPSRSIADNFHVSARDVLPQKSGLLFWGFTQASTPFKGGTLLVGQPLVRTGIQNSGGGASSCDGTFDVHFSRALIQSYNLQAGQDLFAQYWYRDPGYALPDNIGLSNALRFEIAN